MSKAKKDDAIRKDEWMKLQRALIARINTIHEFATRRSPEALLAISQATLALIAIAEKIK